MDLHAPNTQMPNTAMPPLPPRGLVAPLGSLTVEHPAADGLATELGLSRDWRPAREWQGRNVEYIEPLGAIAPIGMTYPRDMRLVANDPAGGWETYWNTSFDEVQVSGAKTSQWLRFYDGSVHTPATPVDDVRVYTGKLDSFDAREPNWALNMVRYSPPAGQNVNAFVAVGMLADMRHRSGIWYEGRVTVVFPLHWEEYPEPFLHMIYPVPDSYEMNVVGEVVSRGPTASSRQQGAGRETWVFEYVEDSDHQDFSGGHMLIRNWPNSEQWWHYYHPDVRLKKGIQAITVAGHIVKLNLVPLLYGEGSVEYKGADEHIPGMVAGTTYANRCDTWPRQALPLPHCEDSPFTAGASWALQSSFGAATGWDAATELNAKGWRVGIGKDNPPPGGDPNDDPRGPEGNVQSGEYRPYIYFQRDTPTARHVRPVLWLSSEQHDAVIGSEQTGTGVNTEGDGVLQQMTYTQRSDWRGGNGSADFAIQDAALYAGWKEGGKVTVNMGWQWGAGYPFEPRDVAVCYIMPGGLKRSRRGSEQSGLAHLGVTLGDFSVARMPYTEIVDLRQAGGMTVGDWAAMVANRLEIEASMRETIDAEIAGKEIPMADPVPSEASHDPGDGGAWQGHLDAVCNSLDLRWGWNREGRFFIDGGPATYVAGDPVHYTLDDDHPQPEDYIYDFEATASDEDFRNAFKGVTGMPPSEHTHYWVESVVNRLAGVGMARWKAIAERDLGNAAALLELLSSEWYKHQRVIMWEGPLRPIVEPDWFVKVGDVNNCDLTSGTVFQIVEHTMTATASTLYGTSSCVAVIVYEP